MVDRTLFTATGYAAENLPQGPERDQIIGLIRLGVKFKSQQVGKRRGFLHTYLDAIVSRMAAPVTFDRLLSELELESARRGRMGPSKNGNSLVANLEAAHSSRGAREGIPIEHVSRSFLLVTYHDPKRGRVQVTFGRLRNIFTESKQENSCPAKA